MIYEEYFTETEHDLSITKYNEEKEEKRLPIEEVEEVIIDE